MSTLYYLTLPYKPTITFDDFNNFNRQSSSVIESKSQLLWSKISLNNMSEIKIKLNNLTFLTTLKSQFDMINNQSYSKFSPRIRALIWILKIVVLPISSSLIGIYFLLLFLLKNKELHELQRSKLDIEQKRIESEKIKPKLKTISKVLTVDEYSDVHLLTKSENILGYTTLLNDFNIILDGNRYKIDKFESRIKTLVSNERYVGISLDDGSIILFDNEKGYPIKKQLENPKENIKVIDMIIIKTKNYFEEVSTPLRSPNSLINIEDNDSVLVVSFSDGNVYQYSLKNYEKKGIIDNQKNNNKMKLSKILNNNNLHSHSNIIIINHGRNEQSEHLQLYDYNIIENEIEITSNIYSKGLIKTINVLNIQLEKEYKNQLIVISYNDGYVEIYNKGRDNCELIGNLDKLEMELERMEVIFDNINSNSLFYIIRSTNEKLYVDLIEVMNNDTINIDNVNNTTTTTTNSTTATTTPSSSMLVRNRSSKKNTINNDYPLANHGFTRRVSAADKNNSTDDNLKINPYGYFKCLNNQWNLNFDSNGCCIQGIKYGLRSQFETFYINLTNSSIKDMNQIVEINKFKVRQESEEDNVQDKDLIEGNENINKIPRLMSLINEKQTNTTKSMNKKVINYILPVIKLKQTINDNINSNQSLTIAYGNSIIKIKYKHEYNTNSDENNKKFM